MLLQTHVDYPQIMRLAKEIFIENLKALRTARGLSQAKLAEIADLSPSIVSDIEVGRRNPTLTTIEKISLALDVPVQQLFYDSQADYPLSGIDSKEELRNLLHKLVDKAIDG